MLRSSSLAPFNPSPILSTWSSGSNPTQIQTTANNPRVKTTSNSLCMTSCATLLCFVYQMQNSSVMHATAWVNLGVWLLLKALVPKKTLSKVVQARHTCKWHLVQLTQHNIAHNTDKCTSTLCLSHKLAFKHTYTHSGRCCSITPLAWESVIAGQVLPAWCRVQRCTNELKNTLEKATGKGEEFNKLRICAGLRNKMHGVAPWNTNNSECEIRLNTPQRKPYRENITHPLISIPFRNPCNLLIGFIFHFDLSVI